VERGYTAFTLMRYKLRFSAVLPNIFVVLWKVAICLRFDCN